MSTLMGTFIPIWLWNFWALLCSSQPALNLVQEIDTSTLGLLKDISAYDGFVYRLNVDNEIHVWNEYHSSFPQPLYNFTFQNPVIDFSFDPVTKDFGVLDSLGNIIVFAASTGDQVGVINCAFANNNSQLQLNSQVVIVSEEGCGTSGCESSIHLFNKSSLSFVAERFFPNLNSHIKISQCQETNSPALKFQVIAWDQDSNYERIQIQGDLCTVTQSMVYLTNAPAGSNWILEGLTWAEGQCVFFTFRYGAPENLVFFKRTVENANEVSVPYPSSRVIATQYLMGDWDYQWMCLFYESGEVSFLLKYQNGAQEHGFDSVVGSPFNRIDRLRYFFYQVTETRIGLYRVENMSGSAATLETYDQYSLTEVAGNSTLDSQGAPSTPESEQQPEPKTENDETTEFSSELTELLTVLAHISFALIALARATPLIVLAIRLITYWMLTTLYVMAPLENYPQNLWEVLFEIHSIINAKVLVVAGFEEESGVVSDLMAEERVPWNYSEGFGLTSNMLDMGLEPVLYLLALSLSILLYERVLVGLVCSKRKGLRLKSRLMIYLIELVSFFSVFSQPVVFVSASMFQKRLLQKLQLSAYLACLFLAIAGSFFLFLVNPELRQLDRHFKQHILRALDHKTSRAIEPRRRARKGAASSGKVEGVVQEEGLSTSKRGQADGMGALREIVNKYLDAFYLALVNLSFPILVTFQNNWLLVAAGFALLVFGCYSALLQSERGWNNFLMNLEMLLFHSLFSLLILTDSWTQWQEQRHLIAEIIIVFVLVGALHEILTFVFELSEVVCKAIAKIFKNNKVSFQSENQQQFNGQTVLESVGQPLNGQTVLGSVGQELNGQTVLGFVRQNPEIKHPMKSQHVNYSLKQAGKSSTGICQSRACVVNVSDENAKFETELKGGVEVNSSAEESLAKSNTKKHVKRPQIKSKKTWHRHKTTLPKTEKQFGPTILVTSVQKSSDRAES